MTSVLAKRPPPPSAPLPRRPRFFRVGRTALRVVGTLHALLALSQAFSIGQYLDGSYALLRVHATAAGILMLVAAALGVVGVLYAVAGGRIWVAVVCCLFYFSEGVQTGMGYSRHLGIHIPLGVAIVAAALLVGGWSWTRAAGRPRTAR
jgi:hypothetical protein